MGDSVAEGPAPDTVASLFTNVYYTLASQQPHRLSELYGVDSQLSHESGKVATGLADIASAVKSLPICKDVRAELRTVDSMRTGRGGYLVLVTGISSGISFVQTFLLDPTINDDSRKHFYCRNDVFRFLAPADSKTATPGDVLLSTSAQPVQVHSAAGPTEITTGNRRDDSSVEGAAPIVSRLSPEAETYIETQSPNATEAEEVASRGETVDVGANSESDGAAVDEVTKNKQESIVTVNASKESGGVVNALSLSEPNADQLSSSITTNVDGESVMDRPSFPGTTQGAIEGSVNIRTGLGGEGTTAEFSQNDPVVIETSVPKASAPKSWASIVSSSGISGGVDAQSVPVLQPGGVTTAIGTSASSPAEGTFHVNSESTMTPMVELKVSTDEIDEKHSSALPSHIGDSEAMEETSAGMAHTVPDSSHSGGGGWNSVESKRHGYHPEGGAGYKSVGRPSVGHNHLNGHPNTHHSAGGSYQNRNSTIHRVYGPSAVIQLGNLPADRLRDWRALANDFAKEFGGYGYEVRHVDVKTSKGLAFIEYENMDGVRAAVEAWADGPRLSGPFKDLMLMVSEKRQQRWYYQSKDRGTGGGRGMMPRGGGRGAGGRGRGRGSSYGGGSSSNQSSNTGTALAPAST